jgi:hypothetical protein
VISSQLYGKAAKDIAPMLAYGVAGYDALKAKGDNYIKMTAGSIAAADEFNDQLGMFSKSVQVAAAEVASPSFKVFASMLEGLSMKIAKLQKDGTLARWGNQLGRTMEGASKMIGDLFTEKNIKSFAAALQNLASTIGSIWRALGDSPLEKIFNIVAIRKSSSIFSDAIGSAAKEGMASARRAVDAGSAGMFTKMIAGANVWAAIISGAYLAVKAIDAMNQAWNDFNANMTTEAMDAVLADWQKMTAEQKANSDVLAAADAAYQKSWSDMRTMLAKKTEMLEKQKDVIAKLRDLSEDEGKKSAAAQEKIIAGQQKLSDLDKQIADDKRAVAREQLDQEIELLKAKQSKYKAEFDGIEKVSTATLRAAAGQRGGKMQTQAEFMAEARRATAAKYLMAGAVVPGLSREQRSIAVNELQRRKLGEQIELKEKQRDALKDNPVENAKERLAKDQRSKENAQRDLAEAQASKAAADAKAEAYKAQADKLEASYADAWRRLFALTNDKYYTDRDPQGMDAARAGLQKVADGFGDANTKLTKETEAFAAAIASVPAAIAQAETDIQQTMMDRAAVASAADSENYKLDKQKAANLRGNADRAISKFEAANTTTVPDDVKEKIRTDPNAYEQFMKGQADIQKKYGVDKDGNRQWSASDKKNQQYDDAINGLYSDIGGRGKIVPGQVGPSESVAKIGKDAGLGVQTRTTVGGALVQVGSQQLGILKEISTKLDNTTIVKTDGGR